MSLTKATQTVINSTNLNADTLDSVDSSNFVSNNQSVTTSKLVQALGTSFDLNTIVATGFYSAIDATSDPAIPIATMNSYLEHFELSEGNAKQVLRKSDSFLCWERYKSATVWSAWSTIVNAAGGDARFNGSVAADGYFHDGNTPNNVSNALAYSGYFYPTRVYNAVYNDLAEYFMRDLSEPIHTNKVYVVNSKGLACLSKKRADKNVIGICSDSAAYIMKSEWEKEGVLIALSGTVNVKVTSDVDPGDLLVSYKDGFATKASLFERIFKRDAIIGKVIKAYRSSALVKV